MKGLCVFKNMLQQAGEGRTIFLTVMVLRLIYKALSKLTLDKRNRSDTVYIANSDKHGKRPRIYTTVDNIFMTVV